MSRSKDMPLSCFTHFLEYTAFGVPVQYQLLFLLSSFSPDYPVIFSHFFAQFRPCIQWIAGTLAFWCGFGTYKRDFTNCLIKKHISWLIFVNEYCVIILLLLLVLIVGFLTILFCVSSRITLGIVAKSLCTCRDVSIRFRIGGILYFLDVGINHFL